MLANDTFGKPLLKTLLKEDVKSLEYEGPVTYQRESTKP